MSIIKFCLKLSSKNGMTNTSKMGCHKFLNYNTHIAHTGTKAYIPIKCTKHSIFIFGLLCAAFLPNKADAISRFAPDYNSACWNNYRYVCSGGNDGGIAGGDNDGSGGGINSDYKRCKLQGYTLSSCPEGSALANMCPWGINLYEKCIPYETLCKDIGYILSCPLGYEPDSGQTCRYDSIYVKCKCAMCLGYDYTESEAQMAGYEPDGEPCSSCEVKKYKRKLKACEGFSYDASNCGVDSCASLEGATCQSGESIKYKECKACPVPEPVCSYPQVNIDTYWCSGALSCLLPRS